MKEYILLKKYPSLPKNWEPGMIVGQGDRGSFGKYSPCSAKYEDFYLGRTEVETNPEFWEEVNRKNYEILTFINSLKQIFYLNNEGYYSAVRDKKPANWRTLEYLLKYATQCKIHSVKRLGDGEVFLIGDKTNCGTIEGFQVCRDNRIILSFTEYNKTPCYLDDHGQLPKKIKSLFTTEDGVDIYEGDYYYYVVISVLQMLEPWIAKQHKAEWSNPDKPPLGKKQFSTKEKAEQYIILNKPCLSIVDILNIESNKKGNILVSEGQLEELKKLVKSKL